VADNFNTLDQPQITSETPKTFKINRTVFDTNGSNLWEDWVAGKLTGYANERGELRSGAYDATSVAFRAKANVGGDNTSVHIIEATLSDGSTVEFYVTAQGDLFTTRNLAIGGDAGVSGLAAGNLFANSWWSFPAQGATTTTTATNLASSVAYLVPVVVDKTGGLSNINVEIVATDTGVLRFGLASDSGGQPAAWLADYGTVVATGSGVVAPAGPVSTTLTAGVRYYIGIVPQGLAATPTLTMRARATCDPRIPQTFSGSSASANVIRSGWSTAAVWSGALSGAITVTGVANCPTVFAKL